MMQANWCFEHPWMTFVITLAIIEAMRAIGVEALRTRRIIARASKRETREKREE